jgi:hypothetical protein
MNMFGVGVGKLFSAMTQQSAQMDALAQSALSSGIGHYQNG